MDRATAALSAHHEMFSNETFSPCTIPGNAVQTATGPWCCGDCRQAGIVDIPPTQNVQMSLAVAPPWPLGEFLPAPWMQDQHCANNERPFILLAVQHSWQSIHICYLPFHMSLQTFLSRTMRQYFTIISKAYQNLFLFEWGPHLCNPGQVRCSALFLCGYSAIILFSDLSNEFWGLFFIFNSQILRRSFDCLEHFRSRN